MKPEVEKVLLENLRRFIAFASNRLGSSEMAEDVVQESLLKALTAADDLKDEEKAIPWFYQILRGTIVDLYRKRGSEQKRDTAWSEDHEKREAFQGEACRCLKGLVPTLKPEYAVVIEALDIHEESPADLAARLGISPGNLKVRRHRARAQLRERLKTTCGLCAVHGCLNCTCH